MNMYITKKKVLHLFRMSEFTNGFVYFMNENSKNMQNFWVYGERESFVSQYECLKDENVKYYPRIEIKLNKDTTEKELQMYDIIVYHGLFDNNILEFFRNKKKLLKKLVLYFWGGDIPLVEKKITKKYIVRNAAAIVTIIPQDYEDIMRIYHPKGSHFNATYFLNPDMIINKMADQNRKDKKCINIQIGNSATLENNHIHILNLLSKYKNNNIKIYVPLSYGDFDYADRVIKYGKSIFEDKLIPMQEFMPLEEYYTFLSKMDVAIFDMKRQQALGNICALMLFGCKLYFHMEGKLWKYFTKELDAFIISTSVITNMSIDQFAKFSDKEKEHNSEIVLKKFFNVEESIRAWEQIFASF